MDLESIDKACPEFHVKFRMLIDQGRLEDGDGKVVDFRKAGNIDYHHPRSFTLTCPLIETASF
ncbi:hypothetical protein M407DRAFT_164094 [Tulasnella calospora MUT 4182]|uniref:Uncharacterized protein n=1 Tax=Tulasnella calospora MUT 4182 TaxID=1051891 RepID=A0A0C3K986_9AGAM|nr:hypothetical protein M407DRAFT_164094 [Tulasnella calospora MUT 4182]